MPQQRAKTKVLFMPVVMQPRQDSNLDQAFRKRLFYPLNYGAPPYRIEPRLAAAKMRINCSLGE